MNEDEVWDSALDAVTASLGDIESSVHGVMPTASWLEVVRMRISALRKQPEVDMTGELLDRVAAVEAELVLLKQAMLDMHNAIVDATSHKNMQANVAELGPKPTPEA
jgi:hypothetical protein